MPAATVVVEDLHKHYGPVRAVDGVSFTVGAGEVFALLGPNGAGKTTTVEILEGFRRRDGGRVAVLGHDPDDRAANRALRERMGVVLQELAVEPWLTVREVLERSASTYPAPRPVDDVVAAVGLHDKADARVKTLSGGQLRRLDLGLGIVGDPELLFLDEPTTGFDPSARREAWEVVRGLTGAGTTVILTTHFMDEAEALADRVAVVAGGRVVAEGAPRSIGGRAVGEATIRFAVPDGVAVADLPLPQGAPRTVAGDGTVEVRTEDVVPALHALTSWALDTGRPLVGLSVQRLTLEDVYLRLTGGDPPGAPAAGRGPQGGGSGGTTAGSGEVAP